MKEDVNKLKVKDKILESLLLISESETMENYEFANLDRQFLQMKIPAKSTIYIPLKWRRGEDL